MSAHDRMRLALIDFQRLLEMIRDGDRNRAAYIESFLQQHKEARHEAKWKVNENGDTEALVGNSYYPAIVKKEVK